MFKIFTNFGYLITFYFVSVFRQGDAGKCWYAVLTGSLDVKIAQADGDPKVSYLLY